MDRSTPVKLIRTVYSTDEIGQYVEREESTDVFCRVRSVTGNEFFEAGRNGISAQYQITLYRFEYSGEKSVELNGTRYAVYRTYETVDDSIELYLQEEAGVTHG